MRADFRGTALLRAAAQTVLGGLRPWANAKEGRRLICHPDLQETGEVLCDTGSPLSAVQDMFAEDSSILDWSAVPDGWQLKEGINRDLPDTLKARLRRFQVKNSLLPGHGRQPK